MSDETPATSSGTVPAATPPAAPITRAEIRGTLILAGFFVACMVFAAMLAQPYQTAGVRAFEDPEEGSNILVYGAMLLVFTFAILWIAKRGKKWLIRAIILGAVGMTIAYGLYPLLAQMDALPHIAWQGWDAWALALSLGVAGVSVWGLLVKPEWWVIDAVGLVVAAASAAIFGISLVVLWVVVLLAALAVYDAIAVYRTKHMLSLADAVIELRLPVLLVIPKHLGYSFLKQAAAMKDAKAENKGEREAMFMGLGDLVMPTILIVSVLMFMPHLTTLPLHATASSEATGAELDFELLAADGHPVDPLYRISTSNADAATWTWHAYADAGHDVEIGNGTFRAEGERFVASLHDDSLRGGLASPMTTYAFIDVATGVETAHLNATVTAAYAQDDWATGARALWANPAALGAALGTLAGYAILMGFVLKGNPQAGLPLLNGGAILGFSIGFYAATGTWRFW